METAVILGGTFNPFHIGHFEMAMALSRRKEIDRLYIMPDKIPPHKECEFLAADEDRIAMCRLAAEKIPKAEVLLIEFERDGKSYTYDTVMLLKKKYPNTKFFMACGGDMILCLDKWYRAAELFKEIGFYAFKREGSEGFDEAVQKWRKMGADIIIIDSPITQVSSTQIRKSLKNGDRTELLPFEIQEYIAERKLYNEHGNP